MNKKKKKVNRLYLHVVHTLNSEIFVSVIVVFLVVTQQNDCVLFEPNQNYSNFSLLKSFSFMMPYSEKNCNYIENYTW